TTFVLHRAGFGIQACHDAAVGEKIDVRAVENIRDHVAGALAVFPRDTPILRNPARTEREHFLCRISGGDDDNAIADERRVNRVALDALRAPEFLAGGRIVRDRRFIARPPQFLSPRGLDDYRRAPADLDLAFRPPGLLPRLLVVGDDLRVVAGVLVALDDHETLEEHGRRARSQAERREFLNHLPHETAVEVVGVETFGAEVGVDRRAVG